MPLDDYQRAVVQILGPTGPDRTRLAVGFGVLIAPGKILTCAHVVNAALGKEPIDTEAPTGRLVHLKFPMLDGTPRFTATLDSATWWSGPPHSVEHALVSEGRDLAVLQLRANLTPSSTMGTADSDSSLPMTVSAPAEAAPAVFSWNLGPRRGNFFVHGRTIDQPIGSNTDVEYRGKTGSRDLLELWSGNDQRLTVQKGFSGAPIWKGTENPYQVVGLIVAGRDAGDGMRDAYGISTEQIDATLLGFGPIVQPANPYPGLFPFTKTDAYCFGGRDSQIKALRVAVNKMPLIVVHGASGVGKSSLVQAGLTSRLEEESWIVEGFQPGPYPWHRLARCIWHAKERASQSSEPSATLPETLEELKRSGLNPVSESMDDGQRRLLIVVDQFEQLLTTDEPDSALIDLLLPAEEIPWVKVLITIRTDFLDKLLQIDGMAERILGHEFPVGPMGKAAAREALTKPAQAQGVTVSDDLADLILEDAGEPVSLPLLGFTLRQMWDHQRNRSLTVDAYRSLGGVDSLLDRFADEKLDSLDDASKSTADRVLLRLIRTVSAGRAIVIRQRRRLDEFTSEERAVVERLLSMRILQTIDDEDRNEYVELAHDSLVESWERLRRLVSENTDFLAFIDEFQGRDHLVPEARLAQAQHWLDTRLDDVPQDVRELVENSRAAAEERLSLRTQRQIAEAERARALAVAESLRLASEARDAVDREPHTAQLVAWEAVLRDGNEYSERVFREVLDHLPASVTTLGPADTGRVLSIGFVGVDAVFIAREPGIIDYVSQNGATLARKEIPGSGRLAVAPLPDHSGVLAYREGVLRQYDSNGAGTSEIRLTEADVDPDPLNSGIGISVSNAGTCLVHVADFGWLVSLAEPWSVLGEFRFRSLPWDVLGVEELTRLSTEDPEAFKRVREENFRLHHEDLRLYQATLDPAGEIIVTEASGSARVWPVVKGAGVPLNVASGVAASCVLENRTIVTGGMGGEGAIWDRDGTRRGLFREPQDGLDLFIRAVDPTGHYFVTTLNSSGALDVRDSTGATVASCNPKGVHDFWSAAFSPDGRFLAMGSDDAKVRVWEWHSQRAPDTLTGHSATVTELTFHPDQCDLLVSADRKGEVRIWRLGESGLPLLRSHESPLGTLERLQNGLTISSDSTSTTVWSTDWAPQRLPGTVRALADPGGGTPSVVLTSSANGAGHLWSVAQGSAPHMLTAFPPSAELNQGGSSIAPDARHILHVYGGRAVLWEIGTGHRKELNGDDPPDVDSGTLGIIGYGFRPDGGRVVVAANNGAAWIWTVDGELVTTFTTDVASPDRTFVLACDPRGQYIATGVRREVGLWDWNGNLINSLHTSGYKVNRVAFAPDAERIVTIADSPGAAVAEVWTRYGNRLADFSWADVSSSAEPLFDRSGRYFATRGGNGGGLAIIGRDGERLGYVAGPPGTGLDDIALSPDGDLVAASFSDGITRIWSLPERRRIKALQLGDRGRIAFSPDGRILLAGTNGGAIRRFALFIEDLFPTAAARLARGLRPDEVERFGLVDRQLTEQDLADFRLRVG